MSWNRLSVALRVATALVAVGCSSRGGGTNGVDGGAGNGGGGGAGGSAAGQGGGPGTGGAGGGQGGAGGGGGQAGGGGTGGTGTGGTAGGGGTGGTGGADGGAGAGGTGGTIINCSATTLGPAANCTNRLFGAALAASHLTETGYATAARELSFVTPENEMKWDQIEPTQGTYTFGPADQIVTFAMQNGLKIKGHTLVWHKQLPAYVTNLTAAADIRAAMLEHINGVMSHYKGKVTVWDVVNEAWLTTGATGNGSPMFRPSVFSNALGGQAFIDLAFMTAHTADPAATLVYNEFADEGLTDKATAVYNMVSDMKSRNIPIDGVGFQMHIGINTNPTAADVATNMQRFAALGVKIYISEMDVNTCAGYSLDQETTQYHDMVAACVAQPACAAVTVWGVTDKFSWLNINVNPNSNAGCATGVLPAPLLWDANYAKKTAYTGALNALLGR
jgi:endo-1,4-beta-xylanase